MPGLYTPFGVDSTLQREYFFTDWCGITTKMPSANSRRAVLRELIRTKFDGVARHLAIAAKKPEGQINDMLSTPPRKAFGEKIAAQLEKSLSLPPGYFDNMQPKPPADRLAIAEKTPPAYATKPTSPEASQLTAVERDLIAGFHAAPIETQAFWINQARYYLETQRDFSERSEKQ